MFLQTLVEATPTHPQSITFYGAWRVPSGQAEWWGPLEMVGN